MTDEEALLRAVLIDPYDDAPRLTYAGWLEDHDRPEKAAYIIAAVKLAHLRGHARAVENERASLSALCYHLHHGNEASDFPNWLVWAGFADHQDVPPDLHWDWDRGFVFCVRMTSTQFFGGPYPWRPREDRGPSLAETLFRAHPITTVSFKDCFPQSERLGRKEVYQWQTNTLSPSFFPTPFRTQGRWGRKVFDNRAGFDSVDEAQRFLSDCAVAYGRERAGLPALTGG